MLKTEKTEVLGWEHVIRGMRNPKNSWDRSDSAQCINWCSDCSNYETCQSVSGEPYFQIFWDGGPIKCDYMIGPNDYNLMKTLRNAGTDHRKFMRMITVYTDITAPLYWWKEYDTYKVGTVANSCSTMHKIHAKEFTLDDFSHEHLNEDRTWCFYSGTAEKDLNALDVLNIQIEALNTYRQLFISCPEELGPEKKHYWWQMIQLLPTSYNQKRTVMLNYEVLANIYKSRKNHKLDEWHTFCDWIKTLPYSTLITGEEVDIL